MNLSSSEKINIAIIGAGIAGLAAAISLSRLNQNIHLIEKRPSPEELGAGIQLSANACAILEGWGILSEIERQSFQPESVHFMHWKNAKSIAHFPIHRERFGFPYLHIHRKSLQAVLFEHLKTKSNINIQFDTEIKSLKYNSSKCIAVTDTNDELTFDYLIAADGIHSNCKAYICPETEARFTNTVAWRGIIDSSKLDFKPEKSANLVMGPGGHLVFYYLKDAATLNYVAVKEAQTFSTESWTEKGSLTDLLQDFSQWHPNYLNVLKKTDEDKLYKWALYDRDPLTHWHQSNALLIGDAAHPLLPFLAQGAAMSIEDAEVLYQCFSNFEKESIGEQFFKKRNKRCEQVLQVSRDNRKLYHESNSLKRTIRDIGTYSFGKLYPDFLNKKLEWLYQGI